MQDSHKGGIEKSGFGIAWYRGPYFLLTVTALAGTVGFPFVSRVLGVYAMKGVLTALLAASLYAVRDHRVLFRLLLFLALPVIVGNWLVDHEPHGSSIERTPLLATSAFLSVVLVAVFARVISAAKVTMDIIFGSVAVYLLFGAVLALLFQAIHLVEPGSSLEGMRHAGAAAAADYQFEDFLYFSFVSLTSLGYGDYAPVGPTARSLAMLEGVVGQLYIAILVARLVGIHISQD